MTILRCNVCWSLKDLHICKSPNCVMEEWHPKHITTTESPKMDSSDSDVDEEFPEDIIDSFVSPDAPVKAAAKPLIEASEEKPAKAAQKPVEPVTHGCRHQSNSSNRMLGAP